MKTVCFAGSFALAVLIAQDVRNPELKHLTAPIIKSFRPFELTAFEIERGARYPSVIHLKGSVEIKIPMCFGTGQGNTHSCAGEVVFRGTEADLREDSGQIEGKGAFTITRNCAKCSPVD